MRAQIVAWFCSAAWPDFTPALTLIDTLVIGELENRADTIPTAFSPRTCCIRRRLLWCSRANRLTRPRRLYHLSRRLIKRKREHE